MISFSVLMLGVPDMSGSPIFETNHIVLSGKFSHVIRQEMRELTSHLGDLPIRGQGL
jgi:hypothetical protein